ncbi:MULTISPECIES: SoxR reducing system RseC family protein [unclassified Fusibacter]|uniref:SoxR reducing system RseC family protein n=1 Tax=unclassified Fusibacter TaxID=2624464 RepID=UPI001010ED3F|nr:MULTISPECIES: SoxR reducing system RseC family protein [unclassified Fusibacter]MCK8059028.1 SoxR reducing system RseC family protein [Fusibacter sp. A2]NPE22439.1 SoxR reducing system RseC family protein [Fusibacter sp. A1]RXV60544.1 sigma E positive regulator RseC/MucC [Fusibacter sp. A1]
MNRIGQVVELDHDMAVVAMRKHTACGDCGACQLGEENMETTVNVLNPIDAQPGDFVEIDMADADVLRAAFLVYIIPLAALLLGIGLTQLFLGFIGVGNSELIGVLVGFASMAVSYIIIRKKDDALKGKKRYISTITKNFGNGETTQA